MGITWVPSALGGKNPSAGQIPHSQE